MVTKHRLVLLIAALLSAAALTATPASADNCAGDTIACGSGSWYCEYRYNDSGPYGEQWLCYDAATGYWFWTWGPFRFPWEQ